MRLRFILIFGNKLIHSYNHDFNYHPNLQHRTIHSTIYSDDWLVNKKNTYNNIRNGRKIGIKVISHFSICTLFLSFRLFAFRVHSEQFYLLSSFEEFAPNFN